MDWWADVQPREMCPDCGIRPVERGSSLCHQCLDDHLRWLHERKVRKWWEAEDDDKQTEET